MGNAAFIFFQVLQRHMIVFNTDLAAIFNQIFQRVEEVIFLPVSVNNVLTQLITTVWLTTIDVCSNRRVTILSNYQP